MTTTNLPARAAATAAYAIALQCERANDLMRTHGGTGPRDDAAFEAARRTFRSWLSALTHLMRECDIRAVRAERAAYIYRADCAATGAYRSADLRAGDGPAVTHPWAQALEVGGVAWEPYSPRAAAGRALAEAGAAAFADPNELDLAELASLAADRCVGGPAAGESLAALDAEVA